MFIKPAVVPRIQPALRSIRDSINISNIRDIRDNYFIRANNRQAGPHPPPRSNRQQQQGQTQQSASENNNNYSSSSSGDEESLGPGFSVCGMCRVCTCIKLGEQTEALFVKMFTSDLINFLDFVKTPVGIIKVAELILCLIINNILTKYGEECVLTLYSLLRLHRLMLQVLRQAGPWLHNALPDQLVLLNRVAGAGPLLQLLLRHLQQGPGFAICKLLILTLRDKKVMLIEN